MSYIKNPINDQLNCLYAATIIEPFAFFQIYSNIYYIVLDMNDIFFITSHFECVTTYADILMNVLL